MRLCDYGCGREAKYQFKNGKWCCSKHVNQCPKLREIVKGENNPFYNKNHIDKTRKKQSDMMKKLHKDPNSKYNSISWKEKKSKKMKDVWNNPDSKLNSKERGIKISKSTKGKKRKPLSKEHKNKISKSMKGQNTGVRKPCSEETKRKIKNSLIGTKRGPQPKDIIKKRSKLMTLLWRDKNSVFNSIETRRKKSESAKKAWKDPDNKLNSLECKRKKRIATIKNIEKRLKNGGQLMPAYNIEACKMIDKHGKQNGYNFQHAENGGEFYIKELGYWVDGYDKEKNVVIEIDEDHHFDIYGNLVKKDIIRQKEIESYLNCNFIRLKI